MIEDMIEMEDMNRRPWETYPVRTGNDVWFYNDACEDVKGESGAFHDIEQAISEAKHFIFICDWSFHPQVVLTRNIDPTENWVFKLGERLRHKAENNPKMVVAIHAWKHADDDKLSDGAGEYLAKIDDNEDRPPNLLWRATHRTGIGWSHHQKYVIVDAPSDENDGKRQVKVFFGGLDLTKGRYDYPGHPIAGTSANKYFKSSDYEDWYNGEFGHDENLPREPWHDIHAGLTGPAAWDFVCEFVGRWNSGKGGSSSSVKGDTDAGDLVWRKFVELQDHDEIYNERETPETGSWSCQVYRSIEKGAWTPPSDPGFEIDLAGRFKWRVEKRASRTAATYERSIQEAYLDAIGKAENYIYIETQYLIGSAVTENENRNLIPAALVARIKAKIEANEPFHVYILLPMFPEGDPVSMKTQPVRYWQQKTMQWMVDTVKEAAEEAEKNWQDYLSFYFLGQRSGDVGYDPEEVTGRKERVAHANRYMIYVHSKMMIVDDNWIIIGSANLNERSMAGNLDTEICAGMWPTDEDDEESIEQIRNFRMRLWEEHLGASFVSTNNEALQNAPGSSGTAALIQNAALLNLQLFYEDVYDDDMNHLIAWPLYSIFKGDAYDYIPDYGDNDRDYWKWDQTKHTFGGSNQLFL